MILCIFFFQAADGIRDGTVTGVQTCALPIFSARQKGATDDQIAAAQADFETGPFTETEKLGFRCAERLHRSPQEIDNEFFARLKRVYTDPQIVELIATAAAFELF